MTTTTEDLVGRDARAQVYDTEVGFDILSLGLI